MMRGGSSHLIGLLVPDIRSSFYALVAQALSKCFEAEGFHLALSLTEDDRERELQQIRELVGARVAGIVLIPSAKPKRKTLALLDLVPHVQVLRRLPALGDWFGMDEERAMVDVTNHLVDLGHRRIAYIGDVIFQTGRTRYAGFCRALAEAKLKPDKNLVELGPANFQFGTEAVARMLARNPRPTAIITTSVQITLGAAEQLMTQGIKVPRELSIVGYGDGSWQQYWGPGLTTLRLPTEDIATACGLWFINALRTNRLQAGKEPHLSMSPISLVKRGSTAPPPSERTKGLSDKEPALED
jgi:LacI family transcriptional regulator